MARVNIDDKLFADPRFKALCRLIGSEEVALGRMVLVFRMAQEYYANEQKLIPEDIWDIQGFDHVEKVGFIERHDTGIYVKGSVKQFEWLFKKVTSAKAGGLKSAQARKEKYGTAQPNKNSSPEALPEALPKHLPKHQFENPEAPPNPLTLTPTLNINTLADDTALKKPKKESTGTNEVIAKYCEFFKQLYGIDTKITGAAAGSLNRLTKEHGKDKATMIIKGYFDLKDHFIASQCHPVGLIEKNINKILLAIANTTEKPKSVFDKPNIRWID